MVNGTLSGVYGSSQTSELPITCIICGETKSFDSFVHWVRNGKRRNVRRYCSSCRELYTQEQISDIISEKLNPTLHREDDISVLRGEQVTLVGVNKEFHSTIPIEIAKKLVVEQAAIVRGPRKVRLLYDRKSIRQFVLDRDSFMCVLCGETATFVQRIIRKVDGGLKTPLNLRSVCHKCVNPGSDEPLRIPVYANDNVQAHTALPLNDGLLRLLSNQRHVHCFCDISHDPHNPTHFGAAIVTTNGRDKSIVIKTKRLKLHARNSALAEAEAILWGIDVLATSDYEHVTMYSDVNFGAMLNPRNKAMFAAVNRIRSRPDRFDVVYLDTLSQKNPLYKLAHKFSRSCIRNKGIIEVQQ